MSICLSPCTQLSHFVTWFVRPNARWRMPLRGHVEKKTTGTSCARMAPHLQHPSHPIYASSALCPLPNLTLLPLQASSAICPLPKLRSLTAASFLHCLLPNSPLSPLQVSSAICPLTQLRSLTAPSLLRYMPAYSTGLTHPASRPLHRACPLTRPAFSPLQTTTSVNYPTTPPRCRAEDPITASVYDMIVSHIYTLFNETAPLGA